MGIRSLGMVLPVQRACIVDAIDFSAAPPMALFLLVSMAAKLAKNASAAVRRSDFPYRLN